MFESAEGEIRVEEKGIFKTAVVGGFERQSVLTYIKNLSDKAAAKEKELTQELWESTQRTDELIAFTKELQEKLAKAESEYVKEKQRSERLSCDFSRVLLEAKKHQEQADKLSKELSVRNELVSNLKKENEQLLQKSKKYDESAMQLGSVMLDAQKKADALLNEAQKEAEQIKFEAQRYIDEAKAEAQKIIDEANEAVKSTYETVNDLQGSYDEFRERFMGTIRVAVDMLDKVDDAFEHCKQTAAIGKQPHRTREENG